MAPADSSSRDYDLLDRLVEQFNDRLRKGERPSVQDYCDQYPDLAADLRDLLPAAAQVEHAKDTPEAAQPTPAAAAAPVLEHLGDFHILREIGHGGMGVVYEAEQVSLGRRVALKVLTDRMLRDDKQKRRFEREARSAAKLHHTNIVPVFGTGEHRGTPYYVMQYIRGLGLDVVIQELAGMRPGERTGALPGASQAPPSAGTEAPRDVSARQMARSLVTGVFRGSADTGDSGLGAAQPDLAEPGSATEAFAADSPAPAVARTGDLSSPRPGASPPTEGIPATSTSAGTSVVTSGVASGVSLPGQSEPGGGRKARKLTYWQSVARVGVQVADALAYAHGQGVIHRDIKPSNLILDLKGTVWVTDFGLAKAEGADNLTHTGDILGTLRYMPPEAFDGRSDGRGDVYSLGLTLYELVAHRPAFDEAHRQKLIKQVTTAEPPRLRKVVPAIPRDLATVIEKAIEKDPARRYPTAGELEADLQRFLDDEPVRARQQTQVERYARWARRNPGIAVLGGMLTAVLVLATAASLLAAGYFNRTAQSERDARAAESSHRQRAEKEKQRADDVARSARQAEQQARDRAASEAAANALAQRETRRAEAERKRAEEQLTRAEWLVYAGKLMLAQSDFEADRGGLALRYLNECQAGLRGWEHRYLWTRINAKLTLPGHTGMVSGVAFSPDGQRVVTGSWDNTAKVWDAEKGRECLTFKGHTDHVLGAAFSPDGQRIVTGSSDKTAKVWDAATGRELLALKGHTLWVQGVAFSPDGRRIVTGAGEWNGAAPGQVKVWDAGTGQVLLTLKGHSRAVRGVAFSPDGRRIVTGSSDNTAKVWDAATGQELLALEGHAGQVDGVAFSPDGQRIVTGSWDKTAKVWDAATGRELLALKGHTLWVHGVAFSPDGQRIVTGAGEWNGPGEAKVWDGLKGQEVLALKGHVGQVRGVAFSPDGRRIATSSSDHTARVWDAVRGQELLAVKHKGAGAVWSMAFSPDSKRIVTGNEAGIVRVLDAATGQEIFFVQHGGPDRLNSVAYSPNGQRVVTGSGSGMVKVLDAGTGRELLTLKGHSRAVHGVAFSPDGRRIVTGSSDNTARVWDAGTGQELLALKGAAGDAAFRPDGQRIVTGSANGAAKVWDAATGRELLALQGHTGRVHSVAFSPDGQRIVTGSNDMTAKVWDAATGRELLTLQGHTHHVADVAFSPDGQRIVTASYDMTARVWDATIGQELLTLKGHKNEVLSVAFSPDGQRIATGTANEDNTTRIWYARERQKGEDNAWPLPKAAERKAHHTEQADFAWRRKQWFAAEFHLRRVLRDDPENATVKGRLATIAYAIPFKTAYDQKKFASASGLWAETLARDPKLGDDRQTQPRYHAARAAILTAAGQGRDEPQLDDAAKAKLRRQALDGLTAELTALDKLPDAGPPQERPFILQTLGHWQTDSDLAGIRDAAALANLPVEELKAFTQLWADVAALLSQAAQGRPGRPARRRRPLTDLVPRR